MDLKQFITLMIGFAFVLASLRSSANCKATQTTIFGALAWTAYVVPKWLIWPTADPRNNQLMLFIGALILIGGPLILLIVSVWKRKGE